MEAATSRDWYNQNPFIHADRRIGQSPSTWARSFACDDMAVLIVCRGPIRKEAIEVFREMGMTRVGILLSEKDSIGFPRALSPELRMMTDPRHVHAVADYTGSSKEERVARIQQIIRICHEHRYGYVFAGYGFMAEDASFVRALEEAKLTFIGPCSATQEAAGAKDEAKRTAIESDVSVTPGVNNATARLLARKYPSAAAMLKLAKEHKLDVGSAGDGLPLEELADRVLDAAYRRQIDLYTIDELLEQIDREATALLKQNPGHRFRLKAIGGGGGKGQRIFSDTKNIKGLAREVLSEVKATGVGDNKNMLIELNIEQTRHNEIQVLGNGEWCVTLGGRDCSLQMHEQKLVEVSITQEGLEQAMARARSEGHTRKAASLEADLTVLKRMEAEAERFGQAVKLDSASTFECIVEGERHYFMEVNTRIQVEHRVSELCYALRFTNPEDKDDHFDVCSLVEAMALIAKHKQRLPRPTRIPRSMAALEVRLNATDRALNPSAGGVIMSWSDPIAGEIRDDQGISIKNPDTDLFMRYRLAGAYDSNVALLLATGDDRQASYDQVARILRKTTLRGTDLATNREFLYGIVSWFRSRDVWAKPTTKFVVPYLTLVGELAREAQGIDLDHAFKEIARRAIARASAAGADAVAATRRALELKETLLERPLAALLEEPHFLSAWLSEHQHDFAYEGRVVWKRNPVEVLAATYHLLHLDDRPGEAAANRIWDHDQDLLETALYERDPAKGDEQPADGFYVLLQRRAGNMSWADLDATLRSDRPAFGFDANQWRAVRAAHAGHQLGVEILGILPAIAQNVGFYDLQLDDRLNVEIPERLLEPRHQEAMRKVLVPPPAARSDEIVAAMGGTYFSQEAPDLPPFLSKGAHFNVGDPLYIIEVMKMFNKVYATFAGTVNDVLVDNGVVVRKGQSLFKVTPDEQVVEEDPAERARRVRDKTNAYLDALL